jgi:GNAT superfamily N-acetyltransferase
MVIQRLFSLRNSAPDTIELENGISLVKSGFGVIAKFLRKFKFFREKQDKLLMYNVMMGDKEVGYIQVNEDIPDKELNIVWIEIYNGYDGNHYATETMKAVIKWAKDNGYKKLTLEVPGISPNARHIYEKLGFKNTGKTLGNKDDMWGGLTCMEKTFASAAKIISDEAIKKGIAKEVAKSTEWIKTHPFDPGLLRKKTVKRVSLFSEENKEE